MSLREIFMFNVKFYRKRAKLTQEELAELCDLSTNYIGDIERKGRKVTLDTIEKVSKGLNIEPELLLSKNEILLKNK